MTIERTVFVQACVTARLRADGGNASGATVMCRARSPPVSDRTHSRRLRIPRRQAIAVQGRLFFALIGWCRSWTASTPAALPRWPCPAASCVSRSAEATAPPFTMTGPPDRFGRVTNL